ncbi:MAG: glycosyltransferase family 4 protein [Proteobacteria bacterium]|nr:glycosyltransferase family 4 protein [Pseudomonadota bacterium]
MKIAYLSTGVSIHDYRFLSKMVEYGHETFLISYFGNNLVNVEGVKVYKYNYYRRLYAFNRYIAPFLGFQFAKITWTFQIAFHLRKLLKNIKPDILHTNFIQYDGFYGALAGFKPTISMPWGSDILINPERSKFDNFATKFTLKKADRIVCDCELVKQKIIQLSHCSSDKITKVLCGVNQNIFNKNASGRNVRARMGLEEKTILLMNRNFMPVYGNEYFIKALPTITKKFPNVYVILIGDGPNRGDCITQVANSGIQNFVHFAGSVTETEMAEYLNAADIYVSTSLSDGSSVSLLEAFACGKPVVVTDIPANREWVENGINGFLVPPRDPETTAKAIIKLLENSQLASSFGERNLKIAKDKANWDREYERLNNLYVELIGKNSKLIGD